mgnify:CR=1 FL=1
MSCKFFSISTYDYIQNTCLHYTDELEVVATVTITTKLLLFLFLFLLLLLPLLANYHTNLLLITLLQILSYPGVLELTTQLLILENILWLPLCRINKFGLNTLPSKTVAIPYTCGLSRCISFRKLLKRKANIEPSFMLKVFATLGQCLWMIDHPSFFLFRNTSILNRGCCMKTFLAS